MSENNQYPREYDAVLGGNSPPPVDGVVLGGIEGLKRRLETGNTQQRVDSLDDVVKYGDAGIDLLIEVLDDEEIEVRAKAFQILNNIDLEKANKSVIDGIPLNIGDKVYCVYQSSLSYGDDWYYLDNEITDFYEDGVRKRLNLLRPKSWNVYAEFAAKNDVRAFSLHPPRRNDCSLKELETALLQLEKFIKIPVYIEVMPTEDYWCSSMKTLVNHPLLIDVSHILIWYGGDINLTQQTCLKLLNSNQVGEIHLSHNKGKADTHDLIPSDVWVNDLIQDWNQNYLVTFESLPVNFSEYERLDKRRYRKTVNSEQLTVNS